MPVFEYLVLVISSLFVVTFWPETLASMALFTDSTLPIASRPVSKNATAGG